MTYVVRIWCPNCSGVDFEGCNQGKAGYADRMILETRDDAVELGNATCNASGDVWDFEVEEWSKYGTYRGWNETAPACREVVNR